MVSVLNPNMTAVVRCFSGFFGKRTATQTTFNQTICKSWAHIPQDGDRLHRDKLQNKPQSITHIADFEEDVLEER